MQTKVLNSSNN